MVHASAVGDYYGEYTFTGEDLAAEIAKKISSQQLTEEEIRKIVSEAIEKVQATSAKEFGKVMGAVMPLVKGKADGNQVNAIKSINN